MHSIINVRISDSTVTLTLNSTITYEPITFIKDAPNKTSPLALKLTNLSGVQQVQFSGSDITISKTSDTEWDLLIPDIKLIVDEQESIFYDTLITNDSISDAIQQVLEKSVIPVVKAHDGSIEFLGHKENKAYFQAGSACSGCANTHNELKTRIQNLLRFYVPSITSVIVV